MSLNKIVADAADAHDSEGVIDRHAAINDALPQILADREMTELCVRSHVSRLIANNAKARKRVAKSGDVRQRSIFGLEDAYIVADGEHPIKDTRLLSRIEFASLISIRQKQVDADQACLDRLKAAAFSTSEIWDRHPNWTWGQVEDAYATTHAVAAE